MEQNAPVSPVQPAVAVIPEEEKKVLMEWKAPSRPFKKRDKDFFTTVTIMAILSVVILFFMREFLVIAVVIALVFLVYVLYTVPPDDIDNTIYTTCIKNGNHFYAWSELIEYWFDNRWGNEMMVARTRATLPGSVYMLIREPASREKIEQIIGTRLVFKDRVESTLVDRAATWLTRKFPLEKTPQS